MLKVDSKFPGGNIVVHEIGDDHIVVSPDYRDSKDGWFYWAFRLCGAAGRHLLVEFKDSTPVGMRGPAVSTDGRLTWHWTTEPWEIGSFELTVPADCDEIYLAFAPTYTQENWDRFMATLPSFAPKGSYEAGVLTQSRKGRPVQVLHVGQAPDKAEKVSFFSARHHCCEMSASWVMEGIIAAILSGETEEGLWLREHASVTFVPFADKDGVEDGDEGKNRVPHDHNQDYTEFLYPETKAIAALVSDLQEKYGVETVIDIHSPWIRGYPENVVYMPGKPQPEVAERQIAFGNLLEKSLPEGAHRFYQKDFYPFGKGWNVATEFTHGLVFSNWANVACHVGFGTTLEVPYAEISGETMTPGGLRLLGAGVAIALARYLQR